MEKLISTNGAYKVYAEMKEITGAGSTYALKFSTEWDEGKTPEKHQKFIMFLTEQERLALKELL